MTAITLDYFKRLEQVGFTQDQATVLVALATEASTEMVTKQEWVVFKKELKYEIELSESKIQNAIQTLKIELLKEFHGLRTELSSDVGGLNVRMEKLEGEMHFIKGLCVFIAGVISTAGVLFGMVKFFL